MATSFAGKSRSLGAAAGRLSSQRSKYCAAAQREHTGRTAAAVTAAPASAAQRGRGPLRSCASPALGPQWTGCSTSTTSSSGPSRWGAVAAHLPCRAQHLDEPAIVPALAQNWQEYKLPFPWSAVLKERDDEATRQMQGPLEGFSSHSLNGPLAAAESLAQRAADDAARGPGLQRPGLELSLLDEDARLAAAAGVAQCKACSVLARHLWQGLSAWVYAWHEVPNQQHVAAYAEELCEYEVGAGAAAGPQGKESASAARRGARFSSADCRIQGCSQCAAAVSKQVAQSRPRSFTPSSTPMRFHPRINRPSATHPPLRS